MKVQLSLATQKFSFVTVKHTEYPKRHKEM